MDWSNLKSFGRGAKLLGASIVYLWSVSAHAADPVYCASDADIVLTTQAQVDGFQETYGPCDRVQKSLTISNGNTNTNDITNLDGLSGLKAVDGSLSLSFLRNLSGLSGLSNISEVGGTLAFDRDLFIAVGLREAS